MRERLFKPFPPCATTHIQPKLVIHNAITHQEGEGRRKEHGVAFLFLPALRIQRREETLVDQVEIFFACFTPIARMLWIKRLAKALCRGDKLTSHATSFKVRMKTIAWLRKHFPEEPTQKEVKRYAARIVTIVAQPVAKRFVTFAQAVRNASLHLLIDERKGG